MKVAEFDMSNSGIFTVYDPFIITDTDLLVNDVTDSGLAQGFSWRHGNVDFYTIDRLGVNVEVFLNEEVNLPKGTQRAIQVPFTVEGSQGVAICNDMFAVIDVLNKYPDNPDSSGSYLSIMPNQYAVIFAQGFEPNWSVDGYIGPEGEEDECISIWVKLWFNEAENAEPKILVDGSPDPYLQLKPTYPLDMNARPLVETHYEDNLGFNKS